MIGSQHAGSSRGGAVAARCGETARLALSLAMALAGIVGCSGGAPQELPSGPHPIIVIDVDCLRADRLGCYGAARDTSPNLDAMASESVRFAWAFAQAPNTGASQTSILTGLYPTSHTRVEDSSRVPDEVVTLAEVLSSHGYATAAFVDGGFMSEDFGVAQGFATYDNSRGGGLEAIGPKALAWLGQHAEESFLLLVHTYDAHVPYTPPEELRRTFSQGLDPVSEGFEPSPEQLEAARASLAAGDPNPLSHADLEYAEAMYDAEIRAVDEWVGTLMAEVRRLGLDRRATIVLVSDHGEEFGEHDALLHDTLYSTVTRVPLLIRLPGAQRATVVTKTVENVDLMPTLLELAGAPPPEGIQGSSLLPLILGQGQPPYMAFGESPFRGGQNFVVLDTYHAIFDRQGGVAELFDLAVDPLELNDLAEAESQRLGVLRQHLDAWRERVAKEAVGAEGGDEVDEATLEQLKSLGYVH